MNWLTNFIKPKLKALVGKKDIPDNLWVQCPGCSQMIFHRELVANWYVCPSCSYHHRMDVKKRLELLFGDQELHYITLPKVPVDPLQFRDRKRYAERLRDAQHKTGYQDALVAVEGELGNHSVVVALLNFDFMGGSMGVAVGEALLAAAHHAVETKSPLIVFTSSGGARMQEGILSLMQMPRSLLAVDEVKRAGLPYIMVLTDPTTGGVSASFAMVGDITLAEPGAIIGFAGRRVIEETIREKLPENFQKAEYLYDHGMVDQVVPRLQLRETLTTLINLFMSPKAPVNIVPKA